MAGAFDWAATMARVTASSLAKGANRVLLSLQALGDGPKDPNAETAMDEASWGASFHFLSRPKKPDVTGSPEVIALRKDDGLAPIGGRDRRVTKARGSLGEGAGCIAGYNGAFIGVDDAGDGTDVLTHYLPDGAQPVKAHVVTIAKDGITILHKGGQSVSLQNDGRILLLSADGQSWLSVDNTGVNFSGALKMQGGVLAGDVAAALPTVIAVSPAWFAQVTTAIGQLATLLNAPGPVSGAPLSVTPVVAPPPVISTKSSASP